MHLLIDTEYPFITNITNNLKSANACEISLSTIPETIIINNVKYILIGCIHFLLPAIENGVGHYTAFCKRVTGHWQQHNDLQIQIESISEKSVSSLFIRPAIIAYIKAHE